MVVCEACRGQIVTIVHYLRACECVPPNMLNAANHHNDEGYGLCSEVRDNATQIVFEAFKRRSEVEAQPASFACWWVLPVALICEVATGSDGSHITLMLWDNTAPV